VWEINVSDPVSIAGTSSLSSVSPILYIIFVGSEASVPVFLTSELIATLLSGFGYSGSVESFSKIRLEFSVLFVEFPPSANCPSAADTMLGINPGIITIINNAETKEFKNLVFIFIASSLDSAVNLL